MIYYTGDIHSNPTTLISFFNKVEPSEDDVIILLGDVGANYYGGKKDARLKYILNSLSCTILCVHGNHEKRPQSISTYKMKEWNGGIVFYEDEYPHLLFAKDGEIYDIDGIKHLAIGGAYSVDKYYRLAKGWSWFEDEQPSDEIKHYVEKQIAEKDFDVVISHTCPYKYEPMEVYLASIDQSTVDKSTELWLDEIEDKIKYKAWFCGHWHTDRKKDKMHFLYQSFESSDQFMLEDSEKPTPLSNS